MRKLLVVCGPTATGKTSLGIKLAQKFDGEIISADSRQIYKGMDIGTGKDLPKFTIYNLQFTISEKEVGYYLFDEIPVWLLDVVEPDYKFSVADYYGLAWKVIEDIWQRGKLPIIVGGTGFYIKAITDGIETIGIEPDWELRKILGAKDIKILGAKLKKVDPERWKRMNESDRKNPRRLIRAIEIARKFKVLTADGGIPSEGGKSSKFKIKTKNSKLNTLIVGLRADYEFLYQRIDQRVGERVKMGAEEEIRKLLSKGYTWDNSVLGVTIGYREWRDYFEGKTIKEEVIQRWKFNEHNYARRQRTWFKKMLGVNLFDITQDNWRDEVEKLVRSWYI